MVKTIKLTKNKETLVDDEDFEMLNKFKWYADKAYGTYYAARYIRSTTSKKGWTSLRMHRAIMGKNKGKEIDHIDGDGLNNKKSNLRVCSHAENMKNRGKQKDNSTGFKGVWYNKRNNKYIAEITVNGKKTWLGQKTTAEEAYKLYAIGCIKYHKEYAKLK